jgi:hypothetical protein
MKLWSEIFVFFCLASLLPSVAAGQEQTDIDVQIEVNEEMGIDYVVMSDDRDPNISGDDLLLIIEMEPTTTIITGTSTYTTDGALVGGDPTAMGLILPDYIADRGLSVYTWNGSGNGSWDEPNMNES